MTAQYFKVPYGIAMRAYPKDFERLLHMLNFQFSDISLEMRELTPANYGFLLDKK